MSDALVLLHTALAIVLIVLLIIVLRIGPVIALILGSIYLGLAAGLGGQVTAEAIAQGFGDIMAEVGLLIAFGVLLGSLLAAMGTLERLVEALLGTFGPRRLPYASSVALTTQGTLKTLTLPMAIVSLISLILILALNLVV